MTMDHANPSPGSSEIQKEAVLKTALHLFNEHGTEGVSLFQIAQASQIDVDQLQALFKNKKAIVRALFFQIELFSITHLWQVVPAHRDVRFADFMQFYFGAFAKYRFFFREFSHLTSSDPILASEWRKGFERMIAVMLEALNGWIKQGLVKPFPTQKDAEIFLELVWVVAAFTPMHVRSRLGVSGGEYSKEINQYIAKFLYPYHTEKGQKVLDLYAGH